jgi:hypothetical protein
MASTYITRTVSSAGNQKTWTLSLWFKRTSSTLSGDAYLFSYAQGSGQARGAINIEDTNQTFRVQFNPTGSSWTTHTISNRKFRDISAWYHIVVKCDTTQATDSNRLKVYINGENQTLDSYPTQNFDTGFNASYQHTLGRYEDSDSSHLDGLLAHVHWTDGYAYDASAFGETDATTGIWIAKLNPSVTYGTNGFFLKFNEGALGTDSSPNGNNFTVSGSLTPAKDTPDNVFTTWNPLENYYQSATLSNGNTTIQTGNSQYSPSSSTLGVSSGKWYWEVEYDALSGGSDVAYIGVLSQFATNSTTSLGTNANDYGYYVNGNYYNNNTGTAYGTTYTIGDIIGVALDLDNNKLYFSKNGTWQNSGDPESGATGTGAISITNPTSTTNGAYFPSICDGSSSANATFKTNFGNGYFGTTPVASAGSNGNGAIFEFDCPSGYYALNTKNINTYG